MEKRILTIKYEGQFESLNAEFIAHSILNFNKILLEINEELNNQLNQQNTIVVNIQPFEKGSFINYIEIIAISLPIANQLFNIPNIEYGFNVAKSLIELIDLKKFLKGDKPQAITEVNNGIQITNNSGEINIYNPIIVNMNNNDKNLNELLNKEIEQLQENDVIDEFEMIDISTNTTSIIKRNEYSYLKTSNNISEINSKIINIDQGTLHLKVGVKRLKKMDIEFYYNGNKISNTRIEDELFLKRVEDGEKFANGDKLLVNMDIIQEYDSKIHSYLNKRYLIKKVIEHITNFNANLNAELF